MKEIQTEGSRLPKEHENYIHEFHDLAMALAQAAETYRINGFDDEAYAEFRIAYESESAAADILRNKREFEPTRSILYRSAASLAVQCGLFPDAVKLANEGLAGNPPAEIAEELREALAVAEKGGE